MTHAIDATRSQRRSTPRTSFHTRLPVETAMGAAIECFKGATAIVVPRTRFAPVKKCNDLLLSRTRIVVNSVPVC